MTVSTSLQKPDSFSSRRPSFDSASTTVLMLIGVDPDNQSARADQVVSITHAGFDS